MGSTFSGINTMLRGLNAHQIALNTTGHNITNSNTDGFSRQDAYISSNASEQIITTYGNIHIGNGVSVESINRARDSFIDIQVWHNQSNVGYDTQKETILKKIEEIFNEPSDTGFSTSLKEFGNSLQSLSSNAGDLDYRAAVVQRGIQLTDSISQINNNLLNTVSDINNNIILLTDKANQITAEINDLNKSIIKLENNSKNLESANDIRDRRDLLVDKLSSLINITVTKDNNGYTIKSGSLTMVDSNGQYDLTTNTTQDDVYGYDVVNINGINTESITGEIGGLINSRDDSNFGIKAYYEKLTTIAKFFMKDFNEVHKNGFDLNNDNGKNFFGDANTNYSTATIENKEWLNLLAINPTLQTTEGLSLIAAKTLSMQGEASGDNAISLEQILTNNAKNILPSSITPTFSNTSITEFYESLIGTLGIQTENATSSLTNSTTLLNQTLTWRESISGVNLDEEMSNMIRFQQGYNASARMMTTMDELLDKLVNNTGVVGR